MSGLSFKPGASLIEGRTADGWVVAGRLYRPALLVAAGYAQSLPGISLDTLDAAALPALEGVDLLLLGSGPTLRRPPRPFVDSARARGWRVEPMDSAAAARTFNVLVAEERLVAALIF